MISDDGKFVICDGVDEVDCDTFSCTASIPNHYWGKVKEGALWFFSRTDEKAYCPEHIPAWVAKWRKKKG